MALTRLAMSHGSKSFPKLCKVFEFLFGVFSLFDSPLVLLRCCVSRSVFFQFHISKFSDIVASIS